MQLKTRLYTLIAALALGLSIAAAWAADNVMIQVEINKGEMIRLEKAVSSVVISDPNTADVQVVSPKLIFVRGKKIGETSLVAVDNTDETVFSATVEVTHNLSKLGQMVRQLSPDADVDFRTVDGGLVMEGYAPSTADSESISNIAATFLGENEKMVNMIKTSGSDQVMLRVKIVEMTRSELKKFGVNLQNVTSNGNFSWQLLQGKDILFHTADPDILGYNLPGNVLARQGALDSNAYVRYKDLNGLLDALETQGLATVLAEPSLVTTSGNAANFLAGGQFPLPVLGSNGAVTIEYKPFGVGLNFTPVVMSRDRISIDVTPEVSTLNFNNPIQVQNITYPILNTRKASAVIELGSGESFMLAGLLQHEDTNSINKFPGVGDVPVLGNLFRSQQFQNNQTELVILVTPYIVKPVAAQGALQTPVDGYVPPNDMERLLYGDLHRQEPMGEEGDELKPQTLPPLHGEGGFITE